MNLNTQKTRRNSCCFFSTLITLLCLLNAVVAQNKPVQEDKQSSFLLGGWTGTLKGDHLLVALENKQVPGDSITTAFSFNEIVGLSVGEQGTFTVVRDAGTMTFEGLVKKESGSGTFHFIPNAHFVDAMKEEGVTITVREQVNYFLLNITKLYVKMLKKQGYAHLKKTELLKLAEQGIGKKAGVQQQEEPAPPPVGGDTLSHLVNFKAVGITEEYINSFVEAGYKNIPAGTLINLKSVGVNPGFIKSFEQLGLKQVNYSDIINFKLVGVTPEYIIKFQQAGYTNLSYRTIVNLKAAGVSPPKK